tara:strand:+ start:29264 stop:31057 length:1794 start_codon:yes stop_codon:yes gene_type:complete
MIKVGLIGYGKWGSILFEKIKTHARIRFVVTGNHSVLDDEVVMKDVEWIFVATPDHTHYEIVKLCIKKGLNVFCEKPLAPTKEQSEDLYRLAEAYGVKLYVDDILNYKDFDYMLVSKPYGINTIKRTKPGGGIHKDVLSRLAYHDFYLLYDRLESKTITEVKVHDHVDRLNFEVEWGGSTRVKFVYDTNTSKKIHYWNGENLYTPIDGLNIMIWKVLTGRADFEYNRRCSLFANEMVETLTKKIFPNVAVVGGGIFGCTAAWMLSKNGFSVELFEQHDAIIREASNINQYRLHRGYHYPRSVETALSSKASEQNFLDVYGKSILDHSGTHEYRIASENSLVTAEQYKEFLDEVGLDYEEVFDYIPGCDLSIQVEEMLFNSNELRRMCYEYLNGYGVNVNILTEAKKEDLVEFDHAVIATYAGINQFLEEKDQRDYQFELCEKPIVELPEKYRNKSIVIMDGPFMCIDPYQDTDYHVMGNVVHAIHHTNIGKQPDPIWQEEFKHLLNKGCVKSPSITNIDKFIESGKGYLPGIETLKHIGSMFTYRVVLPNRDHDDARPTEVENINDKTSILFSGKIGTCVTAAKELVTSLRRKFYET